MNHLGQDDKLSVVGGGGEWLKSWLLINDQSNHQKFVNRLTLFWLKNVSLDFVCHYKNIPLTEWFILG